MREETEMKIDIDWPFHGFSQLIVATTHPKSQKLSRRIIDTC